MPWRGINETEVAFYDILLTTSRYVRSYRKTLKLIARELADRVKSKESLEWTERENHGGDGPNASWPSIVVPRNPPRGQFFALAELMAETVEP